MATYLLRDLNGVEWEFVRPSPLYLHSVEGVDGAEFGLDTAHGVDQRGVTVKGIDYKPGVITLGVCVSPKRLGIRGQEAVDILAEWRDGIGEGEAERGGNQMQFEIADTGRFQAVRVLKKGPANWEQMRAAGHFLDKVKFQSDESDWRTQPEDDTFTAAQFAGATVANHGTVDSWPWFKLTGPITNPTLGIAGEAVALPTLTAGQWLEIDTDPNWYSVTDQAGADRTMDLTSLALADDGANDRWYSQAAARNPAIPVTITGTGTSGATSLRVVVPQIYRSAL